MELYKKANNNASDNNCAPLLPLISLLESPKGSSRTADSDGIRNETTKISDYSYTTTSSSSSDSSSVDPLQDNIILRSSAPSNISKPIIRDAKPLYKNDAVDEFSRKALFRLEESVGESPTSQFSDITDEFIVPSPSPTRSPPAQVMERSPGVFDPDRIPASVFSGPSSPMGWSIASNESLFSIHIGHHSFSRDHVFKMSVELQRPEELHKSKELSEDICLPGEVYNSGELYHTGDLEKSELYQFEKSSELIELDKHVRSKNSAAAKKVTKAITQESVVGTTQGQR